MLLLRKLVHSVFSTSSPLSTSTTVFLAASSQISSTARKTSFLRLRVPIRRAMVASTRTTASDEGILKKKYPLQPIPDGTTKSPSFGWCCTASIKRNRSFDSSIAQVQIDKVAGDVDGLPCCYVDVSAMDGACGGDELTGASKYLDITTSPDWMEFIERLEDRTNDEGGAGAYDTLRCDMILSTNNDAIRTTDATGRMTPSSSSSRWVFWGLDFHLYRLQNSYKSLLRENGNSTNAEIQKEAIKQAVADSHAVIHELLKEAERSNVLFNHELSKYGVLEAKDNTSTRDTIIQLIRMTVLWSPSSSGVDALNSGNLASSIIVRGHACSSAVPMQVHSPVKPIKVTVAAQLAHHHHQHRAIPSSNHDSVVSSSSDAPSEEDVQIDQSLPTRYLDPQNKIASWTRLRKKMENPETYKPPGVSEVLMVRPVLSNLSEDNTNEQAATTTSDLEVLEGLSSNFFVIYNDNTIRTAQEGVLFGYVRHLVMDSLQACGLELDPRPILLHEAKEGLWKEAFITSSSRLIFPISEILVHSFDEKKENVFEEYWYDPVLMNADRHGSTTIDTAVKPKWQKLLDEIMRKGGYPQ